MNIAVLLVSVLFAVVIGALIGFMVKNNQVKKDVAEKEAKGNDIVEKAKKICRRNQVQSKTGS